MKTVVSIQDIVAFLPHFRSLAPRVLHGVEMGEAGGGRMLALHKSLASARTPSEKDRLAREVEPAADGEIDGLVALRELYGLTEEEIRIVEA